MILNKARILLVDDEPLVLEIIEAALRKDGYEVVSAPSSQVALKHIERTDFDGMVCDVRLENLDGFDLLALARKKNPSIAAVLMTGAPCSEDELQAQALEVRYLAKPIGVGMLLETIEQSIDHAKKSDAAMAA